MTGIQKIYTINIVIHAVASISVLEAAALSVIQPKQNMKGGKKHWRKKFIAAIMAGALSVGMLSTGVFATETSDLKGEVNTFIAASSSNAMEEIQKEFNETYADVEIFHKRRQLRCVSDTDRRRRTLRYLLLSS